MALVESYLGLDEQVISANPEDFIAAWENRYKLMGEPTSVNTLVAFMAQAAKNLEASIYIGEKEFSSITAQNIANLNAQAVASVKAIVNVYGEGIAAKYPAQFAQIAQHQNRIIKALQTIQTYSTTVADTILAQKAATKPTTTSSTTSSLLPSFFSSLSTPVKWALGIGAAFLAYKVLR